MNRPLFSIIVPVYNVEKYINKCIDSVLAQTYENYELILVDDGSTDKSALICDDYEFANNNIKVIHKKNGGQTSARLAGVSMATGEYVVCIDGDDWVREDYLELAKDVIEKQSPDIICFGHYLATEENSVEKKILNRVGFYNKQKIKEEIFPTLLEDENAISFSPTVWAKVFKKELYKQYQEVVDTTIKIGEDSVCVKPCLYHAHTLYIHEACVYYYRYNPTSVTKSKRVSNWREPQIRAEHLMKYIDINEGDLKQQLYRAIVHSLFNVVVSQFNRNEKYSIIAKDIKKNIAIGIYPEAISKCSFKSWKGRFVLFALKHKAILLIKLYNILG